MMKKSLVFFGIIVVAVISLIIFKKQSATNEEFHYAYETRIGEEFHVVYDGKDLGKISNRHGIVQLSGRHIAFIGSSGDKLEDHFIYDGTPVGKVSDGSGYTEEINGQLHDSRIISGENYIFNRSEDMSGIDAIQHNGRDLPDSNHGYNTNVFNNRTAYIKVLTSAPSDQWNERFHLILDSKDLGAIEKDSLIMDSDNIVYKKILPKPTLILNGLELPDDVLSVFLGGGGVAFEEKIDGESHIFFKDKDYGAFVRDPLVLSKNHIALMRRVGPNVIDGYDYGEYNVFFDEKNMGEGNGVFDIWARPVISADHIAFGRLVEKTKHIIYDGKDIGLGDTPRLAGDHLMYHRDGHVILDGKDIGVGYPVGVVTDSHPFSTNHE